MESAPPRVVSCLYSIGDPTWQQIWVGQMIFFQPIYVSLFYIRLDSSLKEIKPLGYHFSSRFVGQLASIVEQTVKTKVGEWKTSHGVALWQKQKQQHKLRQRTETIELQTGTPFRQYLIKLSAVEREVCIYTEELVATCTWTATYFVNRVTKRKASTGNKKKIGGGGLERINSSFPSPKSFRHFIPF